MPNCEHENSIIGFVMWWKEQKKVLSFHGIIGKSPREDFGTAWHYYNITAETKKNHGGRCWNLIQNS